MICLLLMVVIVVYVVYRLYFSGIGPLVVYCAHDSVYSQKILDQFKRTTGIDVEVRFDTEATKSLGLTEMLVREKGNLRCDVFWNNELLGMLYLKNEGVLQPYKGAGYELIPDGQKDAEGYWTGFAARLRVWIINTDNMKPDYAAIDKVLRSDDLSRVVLAKPLYGTTRTQYTVLWDKLGPAGLKQWHRSWQERNVNVVAGNGKVADLVASGTCDIGLTDTDDFFCEFDEGKPVAMLPFMTADGSVICIPNTVAIIRGTDRTDDAHRLVEFLLSADTQLALAESKSRQIPLGLMDEAVLPDDVKQLRDAAVRIYPLSNLNQSSRACLEWLRSEYLE